MIKYYVRVKNDKYSCSARFWIYRVNQTRTFVILSLQQLPPSRHGSRVSERRSVVERFGCVGVERVSDDGKAVMKWVSG